jgi:hypothetical protein
MLDAGSARPAMRNRRSRRYREILDAEILVSKTGSLLAVSRLVAASSQRQQPATDVSDGEQRQRQGQRQNPTSEAQ